MMETPLGDCCNYVMTCRDASQALFGAYLALWQIQDIAILDGMLSRTALGTQGHRI
jgi:hypothetical protein